MGDDSKKLATETDSTRDGLVKGLLILNEHESVIARKIEQSTTPAEALEWARVGTELGAMKEQAIVRQREKYTSVVRVILAGFTWTAAYFIPQEHIIYFAMLVTATAANINIAALQQQNK